MLFLLTSFPNGFRGLVFCVLALSVCRIRAVLQFCTVLFFPVPLSVILMVVLFSGNLLFVTLSFVSPAVMLLITILIVTFSFIVVLIPSIRLFLLFCVVILIPLIVSLTAMVLVLLIHPVRVPTCCPSFFVIVVLSISGVLSILGCLVLHGLGRMALWPPVSILFGALTPGSLLFLLQTYYRALTLIILRSIYVGRFRLCHPLAKVFGN